MRRIGIVSVAMLGVVVVLSTAGMAEDVPAAQGAATQEAVTQPAATQNATTQGVELDAKWHDLLARLEDADFKVREAAQEELKHLPYTEQGRLKALAAEAKSPEVRAALGRRVEEIDEELAVDPPPISLSVKEGTLADVAKALSDATGSAIPCWPEARFAGQQRERFTLQAKNESYWDIFCKLSVQHGLQMQPQQQMTLVMTQPGWQRCVQSGGVAIFPLSITRQAMVQLQQPVAQQGSDPTLTLSCTTAFDPRIKIAGYGGTSFLNVVDDAGNVLHSEAEKPPQFWRRGNNQWGWGEGVQLTIPEKPGTKIVSAKGVVHLSVRLAEVSVEVAEMEKNWKKPVSVGGLTVTFSQFDAPGDRLSFSASVSGARPTVVQRVHGARVVRVAQIPQAVTMVLTDATGQRVTEATMEGGMGMGMGANYTLPLKAKFSVATKTKEMTIPFELKDLPLPKN